MVYISARIHKYICIMNITKLNIIISFFLTALSASAMKYQIKVLNTPTITIDNKVAKVGDWFDDQSVIVWSRDNQAMRVVSEDNKVYTLSAKLYKESKSKKFSDFIIYTKPLAARGTNDDSLIAKLQERFDQDFVMLDEIVIDLSDIELPENCYFQFIAVKNDNNDDVHYAVRPMDKEIKISKIALGVDRDTDKGVRTFKVSFFTSPQLCNTINDSLLIEFYPLEAE